MTSLFNWFGSVLGYLLWFLYNLVHNYGIAIIIFTIVTKLLLFPFSVKQQKSMAANSKMAAKQKEIQKKYAKDPQKLRDETQKLYEQENYNPGSGCLTTLIPFPIMLGIYYTVLYPLQNALHVNMDSINKATEMIAKIPGLGASFTSNYAQMEIMKHFDVVKGYLTVFTQDELARISSLSDGFNFFGMNLLNSPNASSFSTFMWLIPVLCLVSSWVMQYFTMKLQPGMEQAQQGPMKMMLYAMPLFTAYLAYTMPGAVGFYWITQTLVSFVQTIILNKFYSPADLNARTEAQRVALRMQEETAIKPLDVPLRISSTPVSSQQKKDAKGKPSRERTAAKGKNNNNDEYRGTRK